MGPEAVAATLAGCGVLLVALSLWIRQEARFKELRLQHFIGQHRGVDTTFDDQAIETGWQATLARQLNRYLARRDYVRGTRLDLVRAGFQMKPTQFFLVRMSIGLGGALIGWILCSGFGSAGRLVGLLAGFAVGYMLVRPFLGYRQRKRMDEFEKHFADGLDIMVGGLESGASLTAAVELVSREMPAPLSTEFARVMRDAGLGMSYEDAFNGMYERVPSDDVGMLVSAIGVQFRVGGNLAVVLRTLGETVRDRQRIRGDIKTLTAQQKMTGWLITGIPILIAGAMLAVDRPYMVQIFQPGPQRYIAAAGAVMLLLGNVAIRRVLRIEV